MMKKKTAKITIMNEVQALISGLTPTELKGYSDLFAFEADGYFFSPEYQLERWDGKVRFLTEGGLTYLQILADVAQVLSEDGYKLKVVDKRRNFNLNIGDVSSDYFGAYGWTLADHQLKAINAILETHKGIIKVGTGGGKTLITAVLADLYTKAGYRTIIIVPKKDLIIQTKTEIEEFGIEVGAYYADEKNLNPDVVVSTWQSLGNNPKILNDFGTVIVDECHGSKASTLKKLLCGETGNNIPIRIGLTGTLPDHPTDELKVFCSLGPVVAEIKSEELIATGWLAKPNFTMVGFSEDFKKEYDQFKEDFKDDPDLRDITYSQFKRTYLFPEYSNETSYLINNSERMEILATMVDKLTTLYSNSLVLVNSVKFGKKLAKMLGSNSVFISSTIKDRKPIYDKFKVSDGLVGIATYSLASTGLNIPRLFNVFLVDGGKSSVRIVQTIGRGLRKAKDKDQVNVIDFYSSVPFSSKHASRRRKIYAEEGYTSYTDLRAQKYKKQNEIETTVQNVIKSIKSQRTTVDLAKEVFI